MPGIKALTFDLYGTLVKGGIADVHNVLDDVASENAPHLTSQEIFGVWSDALRGRRHQGEFRTLYEWDLEILPEVFEKLAIRADPTTYVDRLFALFREAEPFPEAPRVLERLRDVPRVLVTDADDDMVEPVLRSTGMRFDGVVTSEGQRCYKPDPRIFRAALDILELEPHQVMHVGDVVGLDVAGAQETGMRSFWVNRNGADNSTCAADHEGKDLESLVALMSEQ